MDGVVSLVFALIILVLFSAYFSATETAFSCLNKIRLKSWANNNNKKAKRVLKLSENYDKLITNILIGNNIVNITATTIATVLFAKLIANGDISNLISTIVMTLTVLTFGEIIPKTLAKKFPERFALVSAPIIQFISIILYPLAIIFLLMQRLLEKMFKTDTTSVTSDELITIIDEAESGGGIDAEDSELLRSAVEFNDVNVAEVLTPRVDIVGIEKNEKMENILEVFRSSGFSRLPVYDETIDKIIGFIHEKDFFFALHDGVQNVQGIMQNIHITTPQVKIDELLKSMQKDKSHMAVVIDEFGGTEGIVTLEDLIEELVGEIYDESDEVIEMFKKIDEHTYTVNGNADLNEVFELFGYTPKDEFDSNSFGGWICEMLGELPKEKTTFKYEYFTIEVLKIVERRIITANITENEELKPVEEE